MEPGGTEVELKWNQSGTEVEPKWNRSGAGCDRTGTVRSPNFGKFRPGPNFDSFGAFHIGVGQM